jgi:hypothetical protein
VSQVTNPQLGNELVGATIVTRWRLNSAGFEVQSGGKFKWLPAKVIAYNAINGTFKLEYSTVSYRYYLHASVVLIISVAGR